MGLELTAFVPEVHGFRFANEFATFVTPAPLPSFGPLDGLCGGMTFAALDYFEAGRPVPTHESADYPGPRRVPPDGTRLWEQILRRHLSSVGVEPVPIGVPLAIGPLALSLGPGDPYNAVRFLLMTSADAIALPPLLAAELATLTGTISAGRPAPLILVSKGSIAESHQVLATGYDDSPAPTEIYLYDCRYPLARCTLRVDPASRLCTLDAPGQPTERWDAFLVAHRNPAVPGYLDLALTTPVAAVLIPFPGSRRFAVGFTMANQGQAAAHTPEIWPLIDPDPGPVPVQPAGTVTPGGIVFYAFEIDIPATLAGATLTIQAVAGDRGTGRFAPLPPAPGLTNLTSITVPLEF